MRQVSEATTNAWKSNLKLGNNRAVMRATIQPLTVAKFQYQILGYTVTEGQDPENDGLNTTFTSIPFGQAGDVRELTNIEKISINTSIDQDVQTMTMTLINSANIPLGATLTESDKNSYERPGFYTFNRGDQGNPWNLPANDWRSWIVPDRIIRTYEGYGADFDEAPCNDPNMYPSGVWLIDEVELTAEQGMRVTCRDIGRELVESVLFPPIVPTDWYPLLWEKRRTEVTQEIVTETSSALERLKWDDDSGQPYIGLGFSDGDKPYINKDGAVRGHHGRLAFDKDMKTYWLSVGNGTPTWNSAYEWVQGTPRGGNNVSGVRVKSWGGPYEVYISVKKNGKWLGSKVVPWKQRVVDVDTRIPFIKKGRIGKGKTKMFTLDKKIEGFEMIRVTFHATYNTKIGRYPYRAGIFDIRYTSDVTSETTVDVPKQCGNYVDYAEIVKWYLAWAGFYWPNAATKQAYIKCSDGTQNYLPPLSDDEILQYGRVWGDIEMTGVGGNDYTRLTSDIWHQKPVMDGINYIADIVGYEFWVDETGGAIFRSPNIWKYGNWLSGQNGGVNEGRTSNVVTLKDDEVIVQHSLKLSSRNLRNKVFVGSPGGESSFDAATENEQATPIGAVAAGYDPFPSGLRRIAGWTDANFETVQEVETMASLIAVRQALRYRSVDLTISGYPALQIDDQIIIQERVTGTNHLFYIQAINKDWSSDSGEYTYTLTCAWLGEPDNLMTANDIKLLPEAQSFIDILWGDK